jgi:hypothetical protein
MNKLQLSTAALVIGAASMFSMSPVFADDTAAAGTTGTAPMKCVDDKDATKAKNDKDGNPIKTEQACKDAQGKWVEDKDAQAAGTPPAQTPDASTQTQQAPAE